MRRLTVIFLGILIAAHFTILSIFYAENVFAQSPRIIEKRARPLADAAELLQKQYGIPITYEDPILKWSGDIERTQYPTGTWRILPKSRSFSIPIEATSNFTPLLDSELLNKVIDAYHMQTDGPRFKVWESSFGLHIIPTRVRAADGQFVEAKPLLDVHITVPIAKRTPGQHFNAICEAVTTAAGVKLEAFPAFAIANSPPTQEDLEKMSFEWGATDMVAREAVVNLLEHSSTTPTWMVLCDPTKPVCVFNMAPFNGQRH